MGSHTVFHPVEITSIDEENHTVWAEFTDDLEDRDGEIVDQDTLNFGDWVQAPSVLFGHNDKELKALIGRGLEIRPTAGVKNGKPYKGHEALIQFDVDDEEGKRAWGKVSRGFLKTLSVGYISARRQGNRLMNALLSEISFVPVPSNIGATVKSLQDGSIKKDDAEWMLQRAEQTVEYFKKYLDTEQKEEAMTDEELQKVAQISSDVVTKLFNESVKPLIEGLQSKVDKLTDAAEQAKAETDTNSDSKKSEGTDVPDISDDEKDALLGKLDELFPDDEDEPDPNKEKENGNSNTDG